MEVSKIKEKLSVARDGNAFTANLMAAILANTTQFESVQPEEVCQSLGVPESYRHTVRTLLKVRYLVDEYI